jgi:hypothetical protein
MDWTHQRQRPSVPQTPVSWWMSTMGNSSCVPAGMSSLPSLTSLMAVLLTDTPGGYNRSVSFNTISTCSHANIIRALVKSQEEKGVPQYS